MPDCCNGWPRLAWKFTKFMGFKFIRQIFVFFQAIWWRLNGTTRRLRESRLPENYDRCVQVMNVKARFHFDPLRTIMRCDYIMTHNRFESPRFIFENDNVSLMTLEDEGAIFCEAPEPDQQLWKSDYNSFVRFAQVSLGVRFLFVPMAAFLRMAEELGQPQHQIVFLFNTARCGSTLFTQIMEMTDVCVSLSEPDVFNKLTKWQRLRGETKEIKELIRASMAWMCRPYKSFKQDATVIKLCAPSVYSLNVLLELYPHSKHLFMYRGVVKNAQSLYRLSQELPMLKVAFALSKHSEDAVEKVMNGIGFYGKDFKRKTLEDIDLSVFIWACFCREYLQLRKSGFPVCGVRYEDIIKDKEYAVQQILKYCDLPVSLTEKALRGLEKDSQRNSPVSAQILGRHRPPPMTETAKVRADALLAEYGLPPVDSDGVLEGTITGKHDAK